MGKKRRKKKQVRKRNRCWWLWRWSKRMLFRISKHNRNTKL